MSLYSVLADGAWNKMAFNAGIALIGRDAFDPATGTVDKTKILGATTGGWNFVTNPNLSDLAEDVNNAKPGMKQFMRFTHTEPHASGTLLTIDSDNVQKIVPGASATTDGTGVTTVTPQNWLENSSYFDLWILTDYSTITSNNGVSQSGFFAILLKNCLNVGGMQAQTTEDGKTTLPVDFRAFYDADNPDEEPYEIYFKANGEGGIPSISLNKHTVTLAEDESVRLIAEVRNAATATVVWTTASSSVATVSDGVVTAEGTGNTILTASITVDGVVYNDTCTIIVTA